MIFQHASVLRIARLLLVAASAATLLVVFLARLLSDGSDPGSAGGGWVPAVLRLDLDVRLGQILVGLTAAALAATAGRASGASRKYGLILAAFFVFAFVARVSGLFGFEELARTLDTPTGWHGVQMSSVVLVGAGLLLTAVMFVVFCRWIVCLPYAVRLRVFVGGLLLGFGAIGIEAISEWTWYAYGASSLQYSTTTLLEEAAEYAGFIVFLDALVMLGSLTSTKDVELSRGGDAVHPGSPSARLGINHLVGSGERGCGADGAELREGKLVGEVTRG